MIEDKDLHYNMALYMALMQQKYQNVKEKRKQLQRMLFVAASKIQKLFRNFIMKKKTRAAIRLQRWWRRTVTSITNKSLKLQKFKRFYYGLVILKFVSKYYAKNNKINRNESNKKQIKVKEERVSKLKRTRRSLLKIIEQAFPIFIARKSALYAESKYVNKYRQYLRQKFDSDWQAYEKKLTKQLWKEINKRWVKIDKIKGQNKYLNDQDKEVDADEYVDNKLNKIYQQFHDKMQLTENSLKNDQQQIIFALKLLQSRYEQVILSQEKDGLKFI